MLPRIEESGAFSKDSPSAVNAYTARGTPGWRPVRRWHISPPPHVDHSIFGPAGSCASREAASRNSPRPAGEGQGVRETAMAFLILGVCAKSWQFYRFVVRDGLSVVGCL
ncbi:hypothetical protein Cenrod_2655 [Candidatus Symbiobacter mobilis CR]|uniref:Uncharacterized protein n=1 Tax=Candidatus Symbiobacter mobilis CR TaxID=946483 RepID=U5NBL3_9BURK|nr:hypothetical protein Cenrod_2655 [Candidatus Symbiobacter mobilis CR]